MTTGSAAGTYKRVSSAHPEVRERASGVAQCCVSTRAFRAAQIEGADMKGMNTFKTDAHLRLASYV